MVKKLFSTILICSLFQITALGQSTITRNKELASNGFSLLSKSELRVSAEEILSCKEGTVKSNEIEDLSDGWVGMQASDQNCIYNNFYQHFEGCYYTVNKIRFFGLSQFCDIANNYEWRNCDEKGMIDENGKMTEPIEFVISFYKEGPDKTIGELYYTEKIKSIGNFTGISLNNGRKSKVYEFICQFNKSINLESGFISITATKQDNPTNCWFCLLISDSLNDKAYEQTEDKITEAGDNIPFCLMGPGTHAANKAIKLCRFLNLDKYTSNSYQKISVKVKNVGKENIKNPTLELWFNGRLISKETVPTELKFLETYNYTFNKRVDCTEKDANSIVIKNVTSDDEGLCAKKLEFLTKLLEDGENCVSRSQSADYNFIKNVKIGTINNPSEGTNYSNYKNLSTEIKPGEELELQVEYEDAGYYPLVWIDWNGNGSFYDQKEYMGILQSGKLKVRIPEGIDVTPGNKTLRIVYSMEQTGPCDIYDFGETEDYTIKVVRPENSAIINCEQKNIVFEKDPSSEPQKMTLTLNNSGNEKLTAYTKVKYFLTNSPIPAGMRSTSNKTVDLQILHNKVSHRSTAIESNENFSLKYDNEYSQSISPAGIASAYFAQYYPSEMLDDIAGMKLSSIDVYIGDLPKKCELIIFDGNVQRGNKEILYQKEFTPRSKESWNKVSIDKEISIQKGKSITVSVKMCGFDDKHCIGVDNGNAIIGYGDIISIDGNDWYSMSDDLNENCNFCIRTNISGDKTNAINWLEIDKKEMEINPNSTADLTMSFTSENLNHSLYEAELIIKSNDPVRSYMKIPIYMVLNNITSVDNIKLNKCIIELFNNASIISVKSNEEIYQAKLFDGMGRIVGQETASNNEATINIANLENGIYILLINYKSGNKEVIKFIK